MMDGGSDFSVLIVDDHERTRKVMATLVSHLGIAEVVTAGDAQTALAQMRERSFDLVLSDYVMSPMDGFEFKRQFDKEAAAEGAAFIRDMTAGEGYIALTALIFGKWRPVPAMLACLLFGFLDAVAVRLQGVELPVIGTIPVQFIQALPYLLTVILLAGFIGKAVAPKAIGTPYIKEH